MDDSTQIARLRQELDYLLASQQRDSELQARFDAAYVDRLSKRILKSCCEKAMAPFKKGWGIATGVIGLGLVGWVMVAATNYWLESLTEQAIAPLVDSTIDKKFGALDQAIDEAQARVDAQRETVASLSTLQIKEVAEAMRQNDSLIANHRERLVQLVNGVDEMNSAFEQIDSLNEAVESITKSDSSVSNLAMINGLQKDVAKLNSTYEQIRLLLESIDATGKQIVLNKPLVTSNDIKVSDSAEFVVTGPSGKKLVGIGATTDLGRIQILDAKGRKRISLAKSENGAAGLFLVSPRGKKYSRTISD